MPGYNPRNYISPKYDLKIKFAHKERITFPKVKPSNGRVIASLTSWTKRIQTAHLAIQTILAQSRQPDLTVLYLATEEFPDKEKDLPGQLLDMVSDKFQIHWTEKNTKSYKKLIPALKEFPDDMIITFDDDLLYDKNIVGPLIDGYKKYPHQNTSPEAPSFSYGEEGGAHSFPKNIFILLIKSFNACIILSVRR